VAPDVNNPFLIPPPPPGTPAPTPVTTASSTHSIAQSVEPVRAAPAQSETVVFFPTTPGAAQKPQAEWRLVLADGRAVPFARAVFVGRNPTRTPDRPGADLLPIDDPDRSLSKTHALLELDAGALFVHDLNSTNGVAIAAPGAEPVAVEPGVRAVVAPGCELRLGSYVIRVEHA
jgi:hypothetical protein